MKVAVLLLLVSAALADGALEKLRRRGLRTSRVTAAPQHFRAVPAYTLGESELVSETTYRPAVRFRPAFRGPARAAATSLDLHATLSDPLAVRDAILDDNFNPVFDRQFHNQPAFLPLYQIASARVTMDDDSAESGSSESAESIVSETIDRIDNPDQGEAGQAVGAPASIDNAFADVQISDDGLSVSSIAAASSDEQGTISSSAGGSVSSEGGLASVSVSVATSEGGSSVWEGGDSSSDEVLVEDANSNEAVEVSGSVEVVEGDSGSNEMEEDGGEVEEGTSEEEADEEEDTVIQYVRRPTSGYGRRIRPRNRLYRYQQQRLQQYLPPRATRTRSRHGYRKQNNSDSARSAEEQFTANDYQDADDEAPVSEVEESDSGKPTESPASEAATTDDEISLTTEAPTAESEESTETEIDGSSGSDDDVTIDIDISSSASGSASSGESSSSSESASVENVTVFDATSNDSRSSQSAKASISTEGGEVSVSSEASGSVSSDGNAEVLQQTAEASLEITDDGVSGEVSVSTSSDEGSSHVEVSDSSDSESDHSEGDEHVIQTDDVSGEEQDDSGVDDDSSDASYGAFGGDGYIPPPVYGRLVHGSRPSDSYLPPEAEAEDEQEEVPTEQTPAEDAPAEEEIEAAAEEESAPVEESSQEAVAEADNKPAEEEETVAEEEPSSDTAEETSPPVVGPPIPVYGRRFIHPNYGIRKTIYREKNDGYRTVESHRFHQNYRKTSNVDNTDGILYQRVHRPVYTLVRGSGYVPAVFVPRTFRARLQAQPDPSALQDVPVVASIADSDEQR